MFINWVKEYYELCIDKYFQIIEQIILNIICNETLYRKYLLFFLNVYHFKSTFLYIFFILQMY